MASLCGLLLNPNCQSLARSSSLRIQKLFCKVVDECLFLPIVRMVTNSPKLFLLIYITYMCICFIKMNYYVLVLLDLCKCILNDLLWQQTAWICTSPLRKQITIAAILKYILNKYMKWIYSWFITSGSEYQPLPQKARLQKTISYWTTGLDIFF